MKVATESRAWPVPRPHVEFSWELSTVWVCLSFETPGIDPILSLTVLHDLSKRQFQLLFGLLSWVRALAFHMKRWLGR